ncbi:hypothetical protein H0E87_002078, partial [Populus deltoides]
GIRKKKKTLGSLSNDPTGAAFFVVEDDGGGAAKFTAVIVSVTQTNMDFVPIIKRELIM